MTVSPLIWSVTVVFILALLAFDYFFHIRKAHVPTLKEATIWSVLYVGIAVLFGLLVWYFAGQTTGSEYSRATSRRRPSPSTTSLSS